MKTWDSYGIKVNSVVGGETYSLCPQCSNSRRKKNIKCLSVNVDKEVWLCHHCGWSGTLKEGQKIKSETIKQHRKPEYKNNNELPSDVVKWFKDRGISYGTLELMKIGCGRTYIPAIEDWTRTIDFPYFKNNEVVNIKHRDGKKNFSQEKGAEKIFYNIDCVEQSEGTIYIVEGEIDALSLIEVGIIGVISVPDGAPSKNSKNFQTKFEYLDNMKATFDKLLMVVLACDNDEPGKILTKELARRIGKEKCFVVQWPLGIKDANDVLKTHGKEILTELLYNPEPYPIDGIIEPISIKKDIRDIYSTGFKKGLKIGFPNLDKNYTVRAGEFSVVTGIPGHGKSEFMDAVLVNMAKNHGWCFGVFSPENYPLERHSAKIIEKYIQKPFSKGKEERLSEGDLEVSISWMQEHLYFIYPKEDEMSLGSILNLAKVLIFRKGIKGIIIDPWNEIEHNRSNSQTETEYISDCLSKIRRFARINEVHVWVVAHPTKLQKDKEGKYPIPTPYDISGSAHWRNKADNCLTIWRDVEANDGKVKIFTQKIRFKEVGVVGESALGYDYITGCFSNY